MPPITPDQTTELIKWALGSNALTAFGTFWATQRATDNREQRKAEKDRAERLLNDVYGPVTAAYSQLRAQCSVYQLFDAHRVDVLEKLGPPGKYDPIPLGGLGLRILSESVGGQPPKPEPYPFDFNIWEQARDRLTTQLKSLCDLLAKNHAALEPSTRATFTKLITYSEILSTCKMPHSTYQDPMSQVTETLSELNRDIQAQEQKLKDQIAPRPIWKRFYDFYQSRTAKKPQDMTLQELAAAVPDGQQPAIPAIENAPADGEAVSAAPDKKFTNAT